MFYFCYDCAHFVAGILDEKLDAFGYLFENDQNLIGVELLKKSPFVTDTARQLSESGDIAKMKHFSWKMETNKNLFFSLSFVLFDFSCGKVSNC